jgi:maltose alpha-D-glucosyltransferase/alpha-amylase
MMDKAAMQAKTGGTAATAPSFNQDVHWYKDAVIYEVHVRAFFDSCGDGIGDFAGLTQKLDYIQELGVNTIWLLPFYPSPGKDDGYDIADYHNIHPQYGTLAEFRRFVKEVHNRGLRVITELVINHTSDQHPWFQAARNAPAGSEKRNYYVWSDDPKLYSGTRIIFTDTETSNWAWDPVAKSYYWHRFFSHQPDLNFDNPHVERAVVKTMRFWLDMGVDGLRLDAIPYLVERDGTSNENLRETHEVVKRIRKVIDDHYADRMLLGEANMWPEDVRDYFGDGDECHMAYHFPLMPRMYMAIAQEDRHPIVEIIEQTPEIPENCQWTIFLRNHDELTLEMVTSRERDYMYKMYAADPRARLNLGIRRRLAPLMENDPDRIKLMNSLLLSMSGSPVIYYGDEIGMGDNFFLGDRNGVRTPMQWSPDRNAGFSRADPQQLFLPPIMDPVYGYESVNVEAQNRDRSSLLNWMRRMLQVRKSSRAFGRGSLRLIRPGNRKVLAYLREFEGDTILCVVNLSRSAQPVELDLAAHKGLVPVELLGQTTFPPIGDLPYLLTLPGYGFYWFKLSVEAEAPSWHQERAAREDLPVMVLVDGWNSFFPERMAQWRQGLAQRLRSQAESLALPQFIAEQRWFGEKGAQITSVQLANYAEWRIGDADWLIMLVDVQRDAGASRYFLPLSIIFEEADEHRWNATKSVAVARIRQQARAGVLADATHDEVFCRAVVKAIGSGLELPMTGGKLRFVPTSAYRELVAGLDAETPFSILKEQGSNTVARFGESLFLKVYRRVRAGVNPEVEVGRFLTEVANFKNAVPLAGIVEYQSDDGTTCTLELLQAFVLNQGSGWDFTLSYLMRFLEEPQTEGKSAAELHGGYLELTRMLATRTAEMHGAFATPTDDEAFRSEPIGAADLDAWYAGVRKEAEQTLAMLEERLPALPESSQPSARALLDARTAMLARIDAGRARDMRGLKTRHHGDYHLGQVLVRRNDWIIVDFEGEPSRSVDERRAKHSPLRDVAGMLRSYSYAAHAALRQRAAITGEIPVNQVAQLQEWEQETRNEFLRAYQPIAQRAGVYEDPDDAGRLIALFEMEKALYEVRYELGNRPDWAYVPVRDLLKLTE